MTFIPLPLLTLGLSSFSEASLTRSTQRDLPASSQHFSHRASMLATLNRLAVYVF